MDCSTLPVQLLVGKGALEHRRLRDEQGKLIEAIPRTGDKLRSVKVERYDDGRVVVRTDLPTKAETFTVAKSPVRPSGCRSVLAR